MRINLSQYLKLINKLKLKIEEQKYANDNLINEINNFKDLVDNYESSVNEKQ